MLTLVLWAGWSVASSPGSGAANGYWQCDRQCREAYGFFDRNVTGEAKGLLTKSCKCRGAPQGLEPTTCGLA